MRKLSRTALLLICMNAAFWLYFWIDVAGRVTPFTGPRPAFHGHDPTQEYVWFGWGLDYNPWVSQYPPSMRLMRVLQQPTLFIVERVVILALGEGFPPVYRYQGQRFAGLSYAGFQVLATMVLSFGQWYGVARLLDWVLHKRRVHGLRSFAPGA